MTDTKPTIDEQIEYMQSIVATSLLPTDMPKSILASLRELAAIRSQPEPVEPAFVKESRKGCSVHMGWTLQYIDALQSALQVAQHGIKTEAALKVCASKRAEQAEERNKRIVELLREINESARNAAQRDISQVGVSEINQGALLRIMGMSAQHLREVNK